MPEESEYMLEEKVTAKASGYYNSKNDTPYTETKETAQEMSICR